MKSTTFVSMNLEERGYQRRGKTKRSRVTSLGPQLSSPAQGWGGWELRLRGERAVPKHTGPVGVHVTVGSYLLCICVVLGCEHVMAEECVCLCVGTVYVCVYGEVGM